MGGAGEATVGQGWGKGGARVGQGWGKGPPIGEAREVEGGHAVRCVLSEAPERRWVRRELKVVVRVHLS